MFTGNKASFTNTLLGLIFLSILLMLSACGSDDDHGVVIVVPPPPVDPVPPPVVTAANNLNITITGIDTSGERVVVSFSAENEEGFGFIGVSSVRFTLAKLVPGSNGNASQWVNYLTKAKGISDEFPDAEVVANATHEEGGELVNINDGSYQYTFVSDVLNAIEAVSEQPIPWEESLTHRIGLEVRNLTMENSGEKLPVNATFDWVPSGEAVSFTRDIVAVASCNQCHTQLALHGGNRIDTGYCVTCHNPGSPDPYSGETVDFKVMIHKIHRGASLPRIAAAGASEGEAKYSIFKNNGSRDTIFSEYSDGDVEGIHFPQDIRNCTNCHVGEVDKMNDESIAAVATPDGDSWKQYPTIEACGSCHDDMAWNDDMLALPGRRMHNALYPASNEDCSTCHGVGQLFEVEKFHNNAVKESQLAASSISFEALAIAYGAGNELMVTIDIQKDGVGINSLDDIAMYMKQFTGSHAYLLMNWDDGSGYQMSYFNNRVNINEPSSACVKNANAGEFVCTWNTSGFNGDSPIDFGTVAATFADAPVCINGQTNALADCTDGELEINFHPSNISKTFFDMTTLAKTNDYAEQVGADLASCQSCHGDIVIHGTSHAANDFAQCTSCHNATRAAFYSGRPADLKYQVHKLHASNDPGGHGVIEFPAKLNNCLQCHSDGQVDLPIMENMRASLTNSPLGNVYTSPTAVVCTTCHLSDTPGYIDGSGQIITDEGGEFFKDAEGMDITLSADEQNIVNHMILAGGAVFGAADASAATDKEACATCHALGKTVGVDVVHGLANE